MNKHFGALVFTLSVALGSAAFAQTLPSSPSAPLHLDLYETLRQLEAEVSAPNLASPSVAEKSPFDPEFFLDRHEDETLALIAADLAVAGIVDSFKVSLEPAVHFASSCTPLEELPELSRSELSSGSAEIELAVAAQREALVLAEVFGLADPGPAETLVASHLSPTLLTEAELSSGSAEVERALAADREALALAEVLGEADPGPAEIITASRGEEPWTETTGAISAQAPAVADSEAEMSEPYDELHGRWDGMAVYWP
jgi:hypothetical protein